MAVTLTIDDLKYPDGEMLGSMFPDGDINTVLTTWLQTAAGLTTDNDVAIHYVYWRGYNAVANRLAATPSNESTSQGMHSVSWSDNRVKAMRDQADYHKGEYERLSESANLGQPQAYFGRVRALNTTTVSS